MYKCNGSPNCLPLNQLCDGKRQCQHGDDEIFCDIKTPSKCRHVGLSYFCNGANITHIPEEISINAKKLDFSNNAFNFSDVHFSVYHALGELDLSHNNIEEIPRGKFQMLLNLYHLDLSSNSLSALQKHSFLGLNNLQRLVLTGNKALLYVEHGAFLGLGQISHLDLSGLGIKTLTDGSFDGLHALHSLDISNNMVSFLDRDVFQGLERLHNLNMSRNKIADYEAGLFLSLRSLKSLSSDDFTFCCLVRDRVLEDRCYPPKDEISSCEDLMGNEPLRIFLWILGISALVGNIVV